MKRLLLVLAAVFIFVILFYFALFLPPMLKKVYPLQYTDIIEKEAELYHIDPLLVAAIIHVESKWNPKAVSQKGAAGLMQVMPDTASWIAGQIQADFAAEDIFEPETNIRFGCWYINFLRDQFPSLTAALAAYNGGPGNIRQWLADDRWDGSWENSADIPFGETRSYIKKVTFTWNVYRQLYDHQGEK